MRRIVRHWWRDREGTSEYVSAAVILPIVLLTTFLFLNLAFVGYAAVVSSTAASQAAREAAVAQSDPVGRGVAVAHRTLSAARGGTYTVQVIADPTPGGTVIARVTWQVPNFIPGLTRLFGMPSRYWTGTVEVNARKEGW